MLFLNSLSGVGTWEGHIFSLEDIRETLFGTCGAPCQPEGRMMGGLTNAARQCALAAYPAAVFQAHRYRSEGRGFLPFYAQPGQSSTGGMGAGECCLLARRASPGLHPWHGVEVFHQCELPYLPLSPFRHISHTPTLVRQIYAQGQRIHTERAEPNPPTRPTHAPANTHINQHAYLDTAAET